MDQENIMFYKNKDKSYTMTDLYLNHNISFGYEDSYNYYDIDVNKILLFVKSADEYIIRYNDVNKKKIVPLQLKIKNFYFGELHMFTNNITLMPIHSNDKERRKCREICNKINELIGINDPIEIVETTLDNGDKFAMVDVEKNTSYVRDKHKNKLIIVSHSIFIDYPQTSLVQYRC